MTNRAAAWLAWLLAGLSVTMFLASIPLLVLVRSARVPGSWGADLTVGGLLLFVPFLAFPLAGVVIASRHPHNPIGWILLADGLLWTLTAMTGYYNVYGVAQPGSVPFPVAIVGLSNWLWVSAVGLVGTYLILLFPDGRLPLRRWRPLAWLSGVIIVLLSVGFALTPGPLEMIVGGNLGGLRNPFGLEEQPWVATAAYIGELPWGLCMLASVVSLVLRYRGSGGEVRQQIKWIAFAASVVGLLYLIGTASSFILPPGERWYTAGSPLWLDLLGYAALLSLAGVPIAVGFAVLRHRLYDIDLLINRTLVYASLTVMLAAVYFGGVATTEAILRALTGQEQQPQLAVVVSTLAIAALFMPLRRRIQSFIDRRFYRSKYNARKTLEVFSAKLRDETDLDALSDDLVGVVKETMQPAHVSLWLHPDPALKDKKRKRATIRESGHDEE
jgi:hypothetical protein